MIIVVMGVTGSGKTTVGRLLARKLGWKYFDADDFHPAGNVDRMRSGIALDDNDRQPWLEGLRDLIRDSLKSGENAVLACSALKEKYRRLLLIDERVKLVFLKGDFQLIQKRLSKRRGHYMNPALLESQFATLEEPNESIEIDISSDTAEIIRTIRRRLGV